MEVKKTHHTPENPKRCWWCGDDPLYVRYHDTEWGRPVTGDNALFERLCLEGFQAGLSWITILRKREDFRRAFEGFDINRVAGFGARDVERLLADASIVRHRGKIEAAIHNAGLCQPLTEEYGGLINYFQHFSELQDQKVSCAEAEVRARTTSRSAQALSIDMRRRGFKFVGPTTLYALMQATGLVNDHVEGCHVRAEVEAARLHAIVKLQSADKRLR